ncbi:MAG: hypothetical protein H0V81_05905 [Solirubrobacterales bacterium]|nr:hypothetical protein [Solirubrobacterales bacterium]
MPPGQPTSFDQLLPGPLARYPGIVLGLLVVGLVAIIVTLGGKETVAAQGPIAAEPVAYAGPEGRVPITGPWILRSDKEFKGVSRGWPKGGFAGSTVTVPNSPNAKRITGEKGLDSHRGSVGWYRTQISVPAAGPYALRFESVNHTATVWVDGKKLGRHVGEYLPFEKPVQLAAGKHTLVVRADWRDPAKMKREAFHRTWFNFGGINREVTLRPLGRSEITAPVLTTRLRPDGKAVVDVEIHLRNRDVTRKVPARGALVRDGKRYEFTFPTLKINQGQTNVVDAEVVVEDAALWSPAEPNLYDVELEVPDETRYRLRTGLRELKKRGRELLVNGRPVQLRGASIHEDSPGRGDAVLPADMDSVVAELKAIGANATRAQHPLSPALMERLDAAGIMVWMGIGPVDAPGAFTSKTRKLRRQSEDRVRQSLFQLQTHPSLVAWNLANEVAGNGHPDGQAAYIDKMARELKRRDPGRLVALDVWGTHPPKQPGGSMYRNIDAIGDTNYIGWYSKNGRPKAELDRALRRHIAGMKRVFPNKIMVVTEFGAEANSDNASAEPGGYAFQAELLRRHIDIYRKDPDLSGMLVWNLRDFAVAPSFNGGSIRREVPDIELVPGINQKGLFFYDGKPKPSVQAVRGALEQTRATFERRNPR